MAILVQSNKKPSVSFPTLTGSIVTFNSQYAGLPLKAHTVALTATQSGSGTPSPDNVRTINGYSAISVSATGKNIGNKDLFVRGTIKGDGTDGASSWRLRSPFIPVKPDNSYSFMCNSEVNIYEIHKYGANGEYYGYNPINAPSTIYTFPSNVYYTKVLIRYSNNAVIDITDLTHFQIEPFGTYTTITIGSTVYGGEYDARTGVLMVTHGFIASYNGETINEPWISSMDEYVEGTTPTNGAQVVYPLATPQTIQLTPCPIDTLEGVNNIWADTGDTTASFIKIGG